MNPIFEPFEDFVREKGTAFVGRNREFLVDEELAELRRLEVKLIEACETHASENTTGELKAENIVAIHPFHHELRGRGSKTRVKQVQRLNDLILGVDLDRYGVVLVESYDHYALRTPELAEKDRVTSVFFTREAQGEVENPGRLRTLSGRRYYFGGSYGNQCVRGVLRELRRYAERARLRPIKDGIYYKMPGEHRPGELDSGRHYFCDKHVRDRFLGVNSRDLLPQN